MKLPGNKFRIIFTFLLFLGLILTFAKPALAGYGEAAPNEASAPVCNAEKPSQPSLFSANVIASNAVELTWGAADRASSWTVAYGVESGKYIYGVSNFGNSSSRGIKIGSLPSGRYYFAVRANNGCMPGPFSNEKEASLGGGGGGTSQTEEETFTGSGGGQGLFPTQVPGTFQRQTVSPTKAQQKSIIPTIAPKVTPTPKPMGFFQRIWQGILRLFGLGK